VQGGRAEEGHGGRDQRDAGARARQVTGGGMSGTRGGARGQGAVRSCVEQCYALELNDEVPDGIMGEILEFQERGR